MEYAVLGRDFGQGKDLVVLPVAKRQTVLDNQKASTVYEVLMEGYGEDPGLVLRNYFRMEKEMVQAAGILPDARSLRLLSYAYKLTESCIRQPIEGTVVDFIFKCVIEGSSGDSADSVDSESGIRGAARACAVGAAGVAGTAGASDIADTADSEADTLKPSGGGSGHEAPLGETRKIAVEDFRVRYILDMRPCEQKCIGPLIFPCRMQEKSLWSRMGQAVSSYMIRSNDYLMPIIYKEDYERLAHEIIHYTSHDLLCVCFSEAPDPLTIRLFLSCRSSKQYKDVTEERRTAYCVVVSLFY